MLNKKIKTISILVTVVIVVFSIFFVIKKIEAPVFKDDVISNEVKSTQLIQEKEEAIKINTSTEKYIIKDRSVVVPKEKGGNKKVILLTIDDGPSSRTLEMIDILKRHGAKAIFFVNGIHDKDHAGVISETAKNGFAVGNHGWSHLNLKKEKNISIVNKEILKNSELINKRIGMMPRFFRAPYGESNPYVRNFAKDNNMIFMDWTDTAKDWEISAKDKDVFISNVSKNLAPGAIILIHEHPWSVVNLDALLTMLESNGYGYVDPENIVF